jgi:hypothetical protein
MKLQASESVLGSSPITESRLRRFLHAGERRDFRLLDVNSITITCDEYHANDRMNFQ